MEGTGRREVLGHEAAGRVAPHSSLGTPTCPGWRGNARHWPAGAAHAQGRRAAGPAVSLEGAPLPLCVLRALSPSAPKPDSQQEGKNAPKRIIQWLLGEKIVNVLVPFTKPQPKKVTYKIPERKQRCSLWLRLSSCGRELWPGGHPSDGGSGNRMGPDHPSKSRLQISAVGPALTTEAAADSQGCAHRPEAWINRRKALVRNQHTSPLPRSSRIFSLYQGRCHWSGSQGLWGVLQGPYSGKELTCSHRALWNLRVSVGIGRG